MQTRSGTSPALSQKEVIAHAQKQSRKDVAVAVGITGAAVGTGVRIFLGLSALGIPLTPIAVPLIVAFGVGVVMYKVIARSHRS